MRTEIPGDIIDDICIGFQKRFNKTIDPLIIDFINDLQSEVALEEGFEKKRTVRFYNLAVFRYSPQRKDAIQTKKRLRRKFGDDREKVKAELSKIGKQVNIERSNKFKARKEEIKEEKQYEKQRRNLVSLCGKYNIMSR